MPAFIPRKKKLAKAEGSLHADTSYDGEPQFFDLHRDGVTQGFLEKLLTCPHRGTLAFIEGLSKPGFSFPMEFGNAVHATLDATYTAYRTTKCTVKALQASVDGLAADERYRREYWRERTFGGNIEEQLNTIYSLVPGLLNAYHRRYPEDLTGAIQWHSLEEVFSIPYHFKRQDGSIIESIPPVPVRGKIDGTFIDRGLRFMDHKTKGVVEVEFLKKQLALDPQVLIYNWAIAKKHGKYPAGMLYNILRRTQKQRGTKEPLLDYVRRVEADIDERPDFYFFRFDIEFTEEDNARFEKNFDEMMNHALLWWQGVLRYQNGYACMTRYGGCDFLDHCAGSPQGYERREHVYPELVPLEVPSKV